LPLRHYAIGKGLRVNPAGDGFLLAAPSKLTMEKTVAAVQDSGSEAAVSRI
jgi:hypothetical protein